VVYLLRPYAALLLRPWMFFMAVRGLIMGKLTSRGVADTLHVGVV